MPWKAVSISIPDGLCDPLRRIWVVEQTDDEGEYPCVVSAVLANGTVSGTRDNRITDELNDERAAMLDCYARGALLCVGDTAALRAGSHGRSTAGAISVAQSAANSTHSPRQSR
jgi:hypothetical protein